MVQVILNSKHFFRTFGVDNQKKYYLSIFRDTVHLKIFIQFIFLFSCFDLLVLLSSTTELKIETENLVIVEQFNTVHTRIIVFILHFQLRYANHYQHNTTPAFWENVNTY